MVETKVKQYKIKNLDCAVCADRIETELIKHRGINKVSVDPVNSILETNLEDIVRLNKLVKKVEPGAVVEEIKKYNDYYRINKYHQPSDEYNPETTELSGVQLDLQLFFNVGFKLSNEEYFPKWYNGSEFKAARK